MTTPTIRLATSADSNAIREIYAPYIETPITFEEDVPSREEFQARTDDILATHPYLVAELDGSVVGYAYAHELRERIAFQWNAELSVYLAPAAQGHHLGSTLYRALIDLCAAQGIKVVYGIVTSPNVPSERLHDAFGFEVMGLQRRAGFTCGGWHDVTWYVKYLTDAFDNDPAAPVPFPDFCQAHPETVQRILDAANARIRETCEDQATVK